MAVDEALEKAVVSDVPETDFVSAWPRARFMCNWNVSGRAMNSRTLGEFETPVLTYILPVLAAHGPSVLLCG